MAGEMRACPMLFESFEGKPAEFGAQNFAGRQALRSEGWGTLVGDGEGAL